MKLKKGMIIEEINNPMGEIRLPYGYVTKTKDNRVYAYWFDTLKELREEKKKGFKSLEGNDKSVSIKNIKIIKEYKSLKELIEGTK